ncbi:UNVERIFIED_CONTAM: hypothetical protein HDU68_001479 [Siphonaria sp. JEL0065]|nr:hypothetical protein HDU68_001479 [Siphonaria sp. JEL0065]
MQKSSRRFTLSSAALKQRAFDAANKKKGPAIPEEDEVDHAKVLDLFLESASTNNNCESNLTQESDTPAQDALVATTPTISLNATAVFARDAFLTAQDHRARDIIIEHFGFSPIELLDDLSNIINEVNSQAMEAFEEFVVERLGCEEAAEDGLDLSLVDEDEDEIDARLEALRTRVAAATAYNATLTQTVHSLESTNESLEKLLHQVKSVTSTTETSSVTLVIREEDNDVKKLEKSVESMEEDGHVAYISSNSNMIEKHGSLPFMTQSTRDARALSESISLYLARNGPAISNSCYAMDGVQDTTTVTTTKSGDASKFLQGIHVGGVATKQEMEDAREIGSVPETLSRVRWGSANVGVGAASFFGSSVGLPFGVVASSGDGEAMVE